MTEDKFRTAVAMFNIYMTKDEVEELIKRYGCGDGLVRYTDFIQNIDEQFYDYDAARDNISKTKSSAIYNQDENQVLDKALDYIRYMIRTKRILMKPNFKDFDRANTGHVTKEQFTRVLTTLGINLDY
mmetsp:Transcript_17144/g.15031  ORF Transcript_17144/g.15031 Transcript_17144/m.15031 type:complete len:128 (-) Transcript_17144:849-1232(-)